jgi:DNA-binding transcriptional ArsR family regulator
MDNKQYTDDGLVPKRRDDFKKLRRINREQFIYKNLSDFTKRYLKVLIRYHEAIDYLQTRELIKRHQSDQKTAMKKINKMRQTKKD